MQTQGGLPLVDGTDPRQTTTKVHTYSNTWALQGDGYEGVAYDAPKLRYGLLAGCFCNDWCRMCADVYKCLRLQQPGCQCLASSVVLSLI